MTREAFLTIRWNNRLSLALGVITLIYVVAVSSLLAGVDSDAFIGLLIIGAFM